MGLIESIDVKDVSVTFFCPTIKRIISAGLHYSYVHCSSDDFFEVYAEIHCPCGLPHEVRFDKIVRR